VVSEARPGGNVTGIAPYVKGLPAKQLELARGSNRSAAAKKSAHRSLAAKSYAKPRFAEMVLDKLSITPPISFMYPHSNRRRIAAPKPPDSPNKRIGRPEHRHGALP
jgi:hypothetical protein